MKFLNWGSTPETPAHLLPHIRLTNGLLAFFLVGGVIQTLMFVLGGSYDLALFNSTSLLIFGGSLLLMRSGRTHLARLIVLVGGVIGAYWISSLSGLETDFHVALLLAAIFSVFVFPLEDRKYILFGFVLSLAAYLLLEVTDFRPLFGTASQLAQPMVRATRVTSFVLVWALLLACVEFYARNTRRYQETLVQSAKMAALGQMAAGISHEINNPLSAVQVMSEKLAELARRGNVTLEELAPIAETLEKKVFRMSGIIHGLVAFSRESRDDPQSAVEVRQLVQSTLDFCKAGIHAGGIELRVAPPSEGLVFSGHESEISQVLLNLINNSVDALTTQDGRSSGWIEIAARKADPWIEIAVTDSGPGIRDQVARYIFDPFFTTKPVGKGTGLGLSIARGIVQRHGGQLLYDPASPRTRFVVKLPAAQSDGAGAGP
jgi:signal transduction histidine kinase